MITLVIFYFVQRHNKLVSQLIYNAVETRHTTSITFKTEESTSIFTLFNLIRHLYRLDLTGNHKQKNISQHGNFEVTKLLP